MPALDPITGAPMPPTNPYRSPDQEQEDERQREQRRQRHLARVLLDALAQVLGLGPQTIQPGLSGGTWGPFGAAPPGLVTPPPAPDMETLRQEMVTRYGASTSTAYSPNPSPLPAPGPPGAQNLARGVTSINLADYDQTRYASPWEDPYWQQKYAPLVLNLPEDVRRQYGNHTAGWWRSRANWNQPDAGWDYTGPHKNWSQVPPEQRPSGQRTGNMNRDLKRRVLYKGYTQAEWLKRLRTGAYGGTPFDPVERWGEDWWDDFLDWMARGARR